MATTPKSFGSAPSAPTSGSTNLYARDSRGNLLCYNGRWALPGTYWGPDGILRDAVSGKPAFRGPAGQPGYDRRDEAAQKNGVDPSAVQSLTMPDGRTIYYVPTATPNAGPIGTGVPLSWDYNSLQGQSPTQDSNMPEDIWSGATPTNPGGGGGTVNPVTGQPVANAPASPAQGAAGQGTTPAPGSAAATGYGNNQTWGEGATNGVGYLPPLPNGYSWTTRGGAWNPDPSKVGPTEFAIKAPDGHVLSDAEANQSVFGGKLSGSVNKFANYAITYNTNQYEDHTGGNTLDAIAGKFNATGGRPVLPPGYKYLPDGRVWAAPGITSGGWKDAPNNPMNPTGLIFKDYTLAAGGQGVVATAEEAALGNSGSTSPSGGGASGTPGSTGANPADTSGKARMRAFLDQFGLGNLTDVVWPLVARDASDAEILAEVRKTPEYAVRFPGMAELQKKKRAINEGTYIETEKRYAAVAHSFGLPAGLWDGPEDFGRLIAGEVSPQEYQTRLTDWRADMIDSDPSMLAEMARRGISPGTALALYIDPDVAVPWLEKQGASARIGAAAARTGWGSLGIGAADELAGLGVNAQQAQAGFGQINLGSELYQPLPGLENSEDPISRSQQIDATFKGDTAQQRRIARRAQERSAAFMAGGSLASDKSGVGALGGANT